MAEQSISLPETPKSIESDTGNSRRHSIGKAISTRGDEKILPHYLRASTGSCHDFCKFGRKHAFEEKARRPFPRRNRKLPDEQNSIEFQPERNKTSKVTGKPSSNSETPPGTPEIIKREVPRKPLDRKSPPLNVVMAEKKTSSRALLTKSADRQSPVLRAILAKKKTMTRDVLAESVDSQISVSSDNWAEKRKTSLRERNKTSVANLKPSPDLKAHFSTNFTKPGVSSSSEKLEVSLKQASSKVKEENISAKGANSLKMKPSPGSSRVLTVRGNSDNKIAKKTSTSKTAVQRAQMSPRAMPSLKTSSSGMARGVASPRASLSIKPTLRVQKFPSASLSLKPSLNRVASINARRRRASEVASPMKNQSKVKKVNKEHPKIKNDDLDHSIKELKGPGNNVVQEKTLYVIKMETENKYLESDRKENLSAESSPPPLSPARSPSLPEVVLSLSNNEEEEESEFTAGEAEDDSSDYDETEYMEEADTVEGEQRGWHRKAGMIPSQDKNDQPVKLRFRRGKVIDIKPEHNSPRRLKFRQGRVVVGNQNLKVDGRRSFKRRGAEDLTNENRDSEKVVLRHQDVHGKKDAQGLFNNVIEETASKLVETRKSKVKALVGAFETVISLQDSKPAENDRKINLSL
ncbi:uncharacterized protein LOC8258243 [Ricinus communis]|uniref:uncharacterized protein LOC8258243 n=1 Tax=Ricinus communis TaxID=3988 RepID=UPI00201B037C|nr:uncharacterized protein LOC8258243 [Ricinus communis]XP_048230620.1 uncharacterized protein LOC8258243 [Ricinus communis]